MLAAATLVLRRASRAAAEGARGAAVWKGFAAKSGSGGHPSPYGSGLRRHIPATNSRPDMELTMVTSRDVIFPEELPKVPRLGPPFCS